jgi:hypothetical protein
MDHLARVIAITVQPKQIQPCIRILRGIHVASHEHGAKFLLELCFTYTSDGNHVGPITTTLPVSDTTFRHALDARNVRVRGPAVSIDCQPDRGTPIVCVAKLVIADGSGVHVECGNAATSSFKAS